MLIAISGRIGSGKDTVAGYLVKQHGFVRYSWATPVKDSVAAVFGWDRYSLEGLTPACRQWREDVDVWWARRLGIPHLSPRWVLQYYGTDVMREHFHSDIWVAAGERRLLELGDRDVVISDTRFVNEAECVRKLGGVTLRVERESSSTDTHASERELLDYTHDAYIDNNGTLDELYSSINDLLVGLRAAR